MNQTRTSLMRRSAKNYGISTWYHNLPTTILLHIFKYLSEKQLRQSIMLVCKRWNHVAKEPILWKKLCGYGDVSTYFLCHQIRHLTYLTTIFLEEIAEPGVIIRQISRYCSKLKHIAIRNCDTLAESTLRNFIHSCKELESFDISGSKFKGHKFFEEIAGLANLKSVNLSKNPFMSVNNLMSVVLNCPKLVELKVTSFAPIKPSKQLSDEDVLFIISKLATGLRTLCLDTNNLTSFSFKAIMQCKKLNTLTLHGAKNLTPEILLKIPDNLPNLNILKVRHAHQISGSHIADLFNMGKENLQHIISIDFTGCWKITNEGVTAIANCCSGLERLKLKGCKSVQSLQPIRDNCPNLKILNIAFCTNLDPSTILPLPKEVHTLLLDKRFIPIIEMAVHRTNLTIKLCLSEYNKNMEDYIPFQSDSVTLNDV